MRFQANSQAGVTLLEVLISIVVLSIGLLGLAGMFSMATKAEVESYQRAQATILLNDMIDRIASNRGVADCYVSSVYGVANTTLPVCSSGLAQQYGTANTDMTGWVGLLQGGAERQGTTSGAAVGGLVGARGCVERLPAFLSPQPFVEYRISVAWQGMGDVSAPGADQPCGQNAYGSEGRRRVVSTLFRLPALGS